MKSTHEIVSIAGTVTAVFAHRFVIEGKDGKHLADIGPHGLELIQLHEGDVVVVKGEVGPSEIRVLEITSGSGAPIDMRHHGKNGYHEQNEIHDSRGAVAAVLGKGFELIAPPRQKARHFEILGRSTVGGSLNFMSSSTGLSASTSPRTAKSQSGGTLCRLSSDASQEKL